jgi:hypothetical protein
MKQKKDESIRSVIKDNDISGKFQIRTNVSRLDKEILNG